MRVLIVRNNYNPKALESALLLEVYLASQGVNYRAYDTDDLRSSLSISESEKVEDIDSYDLAVVLGGDGTILRTAAQIKYRRIPILGVNFGHLGFMANSNEDGIIPAVAAALAGDLTIEQRTNLCINVFYEGDENVDPDPDACPTEGSSAQYFALNELVLARGAQGRVIDCRYAVSGEMVADVKGRHYYRNRNRINRVRIIRWWPLSRSWLQRIGSSSYCSPLFTFARISNRSFRCSGSVHGPVKRKPRSNHVY